MNMNWRSKYECLEFLLVSENILLRKKQQLLNTIIVTYKSKAFALMITNMYGFRQI